MHIYDWIDANKDSDNVLLSSVAKFFNVACLPAVGKNQPENAKFLEETVVTCDYNGKTYRVTGASRLGDIWLNQYLQNHKGYDLRVNVEEVNNWTITYN